MIVICDLLDKNTINKIEYELSLKQIQFTHIKLRDLAIFILSFNLNEELVEKLSIISSSVKIISLKRKYKLSSLELFDNKSIEFPDAFIDKKHFSVIAGPCTIENDGSLEKTAEFLKAKGVNFLRGGAYKPRTSPYEFQGLGKEGLELIYTTAKKNNMQVVTELMCLNDLDLVLEYADIIQIGARNMQNYPLLRELGKINKPVLLKRGMSASINEFLLASDYILAGGNEKVILCERGIKTFETKYRSTLDLTAVSIIKKESHLPIFVDPSHAAGDRNLISDLSKASLAVGADGLLVEVHSNPDCAICDGPQSLTLNQFGKLHDDLKELTPFFNKHIN
jgi:3-deoxy-7-phosphoheptulonate synthase